MSLIDNMRSKLTAIADAVRTKNGATDTYTLDGIASAILALEIGGGSSSGGDSGGSGSASIENGYTVNFYDADKVTLLESHSAKCGNWIDKPISIACDNWLNIENDNANSFPLTVDTVGVFNLYVSNYAYADYLYGAYGIEKSTYPYILINIRYTSTEYIGQIYFAKKLQYNTQSLLGINDYKYGVFYKSSNIFPFDITDVSEVCTYALNNPCNLNSYSDNNATFMPNGSDNLAQNYYGNFVINKTADNYTNIYMFS